MTLIRGEIYQIRLTNGSWHKVRFIETKVFNPSFGANPFGRRMKSYTRHYFQNLDSGRDITIKSSARIKPVI